MGFLKNIYIRVNPNWVKQGVEVEETRTEMGAGTRVKRMRMRKFRHQDTGEETKVPTEPKRYHVFMEWDDGGESTIRKTRRRP